MSLTSAPASLFESTAAPSEGIGTSANYDVTPDGQRFIVVSRLNGTDNWPITVVVNWMTGLKK